jgi:hypothetical protein
MLGHKRIWGLMGAVTLGLSGCAAPGHAPSQTVSVRHQAPSLSPSTSDEASSVGVAWPSARPATSKVRGKTAPHRGPPSESRKTPPGRGTTEADHRGRTDLIAGGITSDPAGIPTGGDPAHFDFSAVCTEQWLGSWAGNSTCEIPQAHVDPNTGDITATIVDTLTGVWMVDHSFGTLTIDETFSGNVISGGGVVIGDIVAGDGDPTFRCSSGHVVMPVYLSAPVTYGGYRGYWQHGCEHTDSKGRNPDGGLMESGTAVGGISSVPAIVPTSFDPSSISGTGLCPETWTGQLTGESTCNITSFRFDKATGDGTARILDTFAGVDTVDRSHGTLVIDETFTGNILTGSGIIDGRIVSADGDPTFQCARGGRVQMGMYINPAVALVGFIAKWDPNCGTKH